MTYLYVQNNFGHYYSGEWEECLWEQEKKIPQEKVPLLVITGRHLVQVGFPERWVHQAFHNPSDSLATHSFRCEGRLSVHRSFHFRIVVRTKAVCLTKNIVHGKGVWVKYNIVGGVGDPIKCSNST